MVAAGLLSLFLLPLVSGLPSPASRPVKNNHKPAPAGLPLRPVGPISMVINLASSNSAGLLDAVSDNSDPHSSNYGKFLSKNEVGNFLAPNNASLTAVSGWLAENNITYRSISPFGHMLEIRPTVDQANSLLQAEFLDYRMEEWNTTLTRTTSLSLPPHVQDHIAFIYPTTQFFPPILSKPNIQLVQRSGRRQSSGGDIPASCAENITPECLQRLYNLPTAPATATANSLAVSGFLNEVANSADLQQFVAQFRPDVANATFAVQSVDGGADGGPGTVEASLDIQYTAGLATNVPTTFVSVGTNNPDGVNGFLDIVNFLLGLDDPPLVLTTSFGFDETFLEQAPEIAQTLCDAYAALGARGTSVLFASGDGGVAGSRPSDSCDTFVPTFPGTCPYITSVGSTQGISPEVAAPFSAGGFSNIFPRPAYQDSAVQTYLAGLGGAHAGLFNASGRAYPDVSTQGSNFLVNIAGTVQPVSGTSASSPTFASVVALLNDRRLSAGLPPLGFLNPLLYSSASTAFNDITSGNNPGCGTQGFPAAPGWDPVTGLGTPDFDKLSGAVGGGSGIGASVR